MPPFIIQLYPFRYFMSSQDFYWFANFCQVMYYRTWLGFIHSHKYILSTNELGSAIYCWRNQKCMKSVLCPQRTHRLAGELRQDYNSNIRWNGRSANREVQRAMVFKGEWNHFQMGRSKKASWKKWYLCWASKGKISTEGDEWKKRK